MIGVENGYPIGENIDIIDEFYKRGARYMSLSIMVIINYQIAILENMKDFISQWSK